MEEAPSHGGDGVTMGEVGSFHGGGLAPDAILLSVKEEGDVPVVKEGLRESVVTYDPIHIVKLKILDTELDLLPVQVCL